MKTAQLSVLIFGRDAHLLEARKWILQSRGYRVSTVSRLAELDAIALVPAVSLLVLCHTLSRKDCKQAVAHASARWPDVKKLVLLADASEKGDGILGLVSQSLDGPSQLLSTVGQLVGYAGSSSYSHIY
jgi:DNA-binding response OmpR family regulator